MNLIVWKSNLLHILVRIKSLSRIGSLALPDHPTIRRRLFLLVVLAISWAHDGGVQVVVHTLCSDRHFLRLALHLTVRNVQLAFVLGHTRTLVGDFLASLPIHRLSRPLESTRILALVLGCLGDLLLLLIWQRGRVQVDTFPLLRAGSWRLLRVERLLAVSHALHLLESL